jgi:hypothetical protein
MLRWFYKKLKPLAGGLLGTIAALWLVAAVAPCVMAQSNEMNRAPVHFLISLDSVYIDNNDCGPAATVDCQLPDVNSPIAAAHGNYAITPALLVLLPVPTDLPNDGKYSRHGLFALDIPAPPLHIQHLTLLI